MAKKKPHPITKLGLPGLDQAKAAVLGSLHSPESQRGYQHSIHDFINWYCSEPRLSFNKNVVTRYRIHLESPSLTPGTINVRLAAIRGLAYEAADALSRKTFAASKLALPNSSQIVWKRRKPCAPIAPRSSGFPGGSIVWDIGRRDPLSLTTSNNRLELLDDCAPATVNRYLAALKATFSLVVRNKKAEANPVKTVRLLKENNQRVRWLPKKYRLLVIVSLNTGLRKSEQLNLQWRDVDFRQGLLLVRNLKPGDSRYVPMNAVVVQTLKALPRRIHSPFVFAGRKAGAHMNDLPKYWEEYLKKAKIENFHWHDLRHAFASRLVMAGADLYTVKKLLGHHDMKMTERYAHLAPDFLKGAVDLLTKKTGTKTGTKKN